MKNIVNEKEILEALERQAFLIEQKLNNEVLNIGELNDNLPSDISVGISDLETMLPIYLSDKALVLLDLPRKEYFENPMLFIKDRIYPGDFNKSVNIVSNHFSTHSRDLPIGFIQRAKLNGAQKFSGMFTVTKRNTKARQLSNIVINLQVLGQVTNKTLRVLEETLYMRNNYHKFASLTTREKEIITLLALGYQNKEIGEQLFISKATVEQHRKNLKRKLNIQRFVDLIHFAQAFDLI